MREPDVVGGQVTSVHLESRIVAGRRLPIGTRRSRFEVPTTPEAVALRHLATHVDDLAIPGKLPEYSADSQALEPLNWSFSSVRRCRWGSCLRDLLFVVHARAFSPRRWRHSGYGRTQPPAATYLTSESSLNIGRYMEMMITPTIIPTPIIMSGSMIAVSEAIALSTSSS